MNRTPVISSTIKSMGYDEIQKLLEVEFQNESVYRYEQVPPGVMEDFRKAESPGSFLAQHIKGHYSFCKMKGPKPKEAKKNEEI